ncbi:MAG: tetratricopeptide repeat protein, partial [Chitinophagaceae bacterium]|nr:tetratricopeptide repeat protein [Chitinophagaceae bacterium]
HDKGWCENELGKYDDAVTSLNQSITLDDSYIDAYSELGYAYYKLSKNDEAIANYRTAMNMSNGQNYRYILNLANVYYTNLKNYDSAIVYFEKGLQLQNEDKNAYYKLGWCYNDKKQYDKAISPLQKALILDPDFINAKTELGYANYKLDRYDAALVQFQAIMKKNPDHELSRYYAGFCYYLKNDRDNLKKMID